MPSPTIEPLALPDVNVLVALLHPNHVHHQLAHAWFENTAAYATTPITEAWLVRLALNTLVTGATTTTSAALASLRSLRDDPRASFLVDDSTLAMPEVDLTGLVGHRQVTDIHLVNLVAKHSAVLVTFDRALRQTLMPTDRDHVHVIG